MGTPDSAGTIIATVVGDVRVPGVHEVELGTPFSELIELCGGAQPNRSLKAAFSGVSNAVLPGITRLAVMRLAGEAGLRLEERAIGVDEAYAAAEVFFTSASNFVVPVVAIDGRAVGDGRPGRHTRRLMELYLAAARQGSGPGGAER